MQPSFLELIAQGIPGMMATSWLQADPANSASFDHARYEKLVGTYMVIGGKHDYKGYYCQIREYLGNFKFHLVHRLASRLLEVHVDNLLST
jgi:hypothetical protein